jgi:hypothetical protein
MKFNHKVDEYSGASISIDLAHHEVHEGDAFRVSYPNTNVSSGAQTLFYVKAPNSDKRMHTVFSVEANLPGLLYFYEGPTISGSAIGTALTIFNFDRNSTKASQATAYHTPTISGTAYGTMISTRTLGSASGPGGNTRVGGAARDTFEYILKKNEGYLLRFIADTNGTRITNIAEWYEL